jgi:hypothetical protein
MISESFQNIVNPNNNVDENTNTDDFNKYYEITSDLDSQCGNILSEMNLPNYQIGESCVQGGRKYAKSDKDFATLRSEYLEALNGEYRKITSDMSLTDFEKHSQLSCLMNKLLENIVSVSGSNQELLHKNLEKEQLARENERIIETNSSLKAKEKNAGLVKEAEIIGSEGNAKRVRTQYIIFISLILIFLVIQLVIFFV